MTRPQRGYVYKAFGAWHVRYRENVWQPDETTKRVQVSRRIASLSECPRKSDARRRADEIMHAINTDVTSSCSTISDSVRCHLPIEYAADSTPVVAGKEAGASWNARGMENALVF